ncbi:hypothetical protein L9F63_002406, partial [Diploptera punctata]
MYGNEVWTINKYYKNRLIALEMNYLPRKSRLEHVTKKEIRNIMEAEEGIIERIEEKELKKKKRGRPRLTWKENMKTVMQARGLNIEDAQDHRLWRFGTGKRQQLIMVNKFKSMNFDIPDERDLISKFIESTPDGNDISKFVKSTPDGNVIEGDSNEYPLPCLKNMKYEHCSIGDTFVVIEFLFKLSSELCNQAWFFRNLKVHSSKIQKQQKRLQEYTTLHHGPKKD